MNAVEKFLPMFNSRIFVRVMRWTVGICLLLSLVLVVNPQAASATLREIQESPTKMLYQSRQSLKDADGNTWQVVFFKRVEAGKSPTINLRLVGFPDITKFAHPAPLKIRPNPTLEVTATDLFARETPADNVGQYDFDGLLEKLPDNTFWELELPLERSESITLKVPFFLIQEWNKVLDQNT